MRNRPGVQAAKPARNQGTNQGPKPVAAHAPGRSPARVVQPAPERMAGGILGEGPETSLDRLPESAGDAAEAVPKVSIVTPVWNAAATIAATIASVRAQSFTDWEMILVDDASIDGSRALLRRLAAEEPRLRLIERDRNGGAATARNAAIRSARGRFIAFLDANDRWHPEKLARQIAFMEAGGHALTFTGYRRMAPDGQPMGEVVPPVRIDREGLLRGNVIGCLTAIYDRTVFGRAEMPPVRRRQDYGLWLMLLRQVPFAHALPEVLADYRVASSSLSGGKIGAARATWRLYREVEGFGPLRAGYYLAHNLTRAALKRV